VLELEAEGELGGLHASLSGVGVSSMRAKPRLQPPSEGVADDGGAIVLALEQRQRQRGEGVLAADVAQLPEADGGVGSALDEPHDETRALGGGEGDFRRRSARGRSSSGPES